MPATGRGSVVRQARLSPHSPDSSATTSTSYAAAPWVKRAASAAIDMWPVSVRCAPGSCVQGLSATMRRPNFRAARRTASAYSASPGAGPTARKMLRQRFTARYCASASASIARLGSTWNRLLRQASLRSASSGAAMFSSSAAGSAAACSSTSAGTSATTSRMPAASRPRSASSAASGASVRRSSST